MEYIKSRERKVKTQERWDGYFSTTGLNTIIKVDDNDDDDFKEC